MNKGLAFRVQALNPFIIMSHSDNPLDSYMSECLGYGR
jgi:hypothetical protein